MRKDCWIRGQGPLVSFAEAFRAELQDRPSTLLSEALPVVDGSTQSLALG